MESFSVIRASAFRALKPFLFDKIIPLELATVVKQRYGFIKSSEVGLLAQPADFQAGKFTQASRTVAIEQFLVAYIGNRATSLGASTRESTDASDTFLNDVVQWASIEYGLDTAEVFPRSYFSQVEFVLSKPLSRHFTELGEIGEAITSYVQGYGLKECPSYEFGGFSMHFDLVKNDNLKPSPQPFAIERRVGSSYDERKYFSQAPLRTQDHKAVLERLEKLLNL
jgi:hypothetical protein